MSKIVFSTDDFYFHPKVDFFGMYDYLYDLVVKEGQNIEDIEQDADYLDNAKKYTSKSIAEYVTNYENVACLALIGSGTNWRGTFSGGKVFLPEEEEIEDAIFRSGSFDKIEITYEDNDPTMLVQYSDHDWNNYMNIEIIFKRHLPKDIVKQIEDGEYDMEDIMWYLLQNPRKEPTYIPYTAVITE